MDKRDYGDFQFHTQHKPIHPPQPSPITDFVALYNTSHDLIVLPLYYLYVYLPQLLEVT